MPHERVNVFKIYYTQHDYTPARYIIFHNRNDGLIKSSLLQYYVEKQIQINQGQP